MKDTLLTLAPFLTASLVCARPDPSHWSHAPTPPMGCRFGLFTFATKAAGGAADFDYFRADGRLMAAP